MPGDFFLSLYLFSWIIFIPPGLHECQIFATKCNESVESQTAWEKCEKNKNHKDFLSVQDLKLNHLLGNLSDDDFELLRAAIDLTVRIRVDYTSPGRPKHDALSELRGSDTLRLGTGFIRYVSADVGKPCPCCECDGVVVRKFWTLTILTAQHVVYNGEEAKRTKVDLFYDDERSEQDGEVVTLRALGVVWSSSDRDVCHMECVTHDENIGERIEYLYRRRLSLICSNESSHSQSEPKHRGLWYSLAQLFTAPRRHDLALIISHPHGQPKKITIGKVRGAVNFVDDVYAEYHTATCPGSSGAPVVPLHRCCRNKGLREWRSRHLHWGFLHCGTHGRPLSALKDHVNYGNYWFSR